jgi:putative FmdB family regulatory protein
MPTYTYRREDGSTFDVRQKFLDAPLTRDPATGQKVVRVVQAAGIIFKGSGFYVNDSKSASRSSVNNTANGQKDKTETKTETKKETAGILTVVRQTLQDFLFKLGAHAGQFLEPVVEAKLFEFLECSD